ncbi:MAG: hypothetical protein RLZZ26_326 [Candidatus Parcubacteria bacterium]|jgi:hypothetical protein
MTKKVVAGQKKYGYKTEMAIAASQKALKGTAFVPLCVPCPGCHNKVVNGEVGCTNGHGQVVYVPLRAATECDGKKPKVGVVGRQSMVLRRRG